SNAVVHTTDKNESLIIAIYNARRKHLCTGVYKYEDNVLTNVMEDTHISTEALKEYLESLNKTYIYVGKDPEKLQHQLAGKIKSYLPDDSRMYDIKEEPVKNVYELKPRYLQLSESEQNRKNNQTTR